MREVLNPDLEVCQGARLDQLLIHVGFEGQLLNVHIMAERDETLAAHVGLVVGVLHRTQHAEDLTVLAHEHLAAEFEISGKARAQAAPARPSFDGKKLLFSWMAIEEDEAFKEAKANGEIEIGNESVLAFDQEVDDIYESDVTRLGSLTKLGAGNLTLTGDNIYSGGTCTNAGTTYASHPTYN